MGQESGPNVAGPFANGVCVTGMKFVQNLNLSSRQKKDKLWIHSKALGGIPFFWGDWYLEAE